MATSLDYILRMKDWKDIYKLVREARRSWRGIGIEFGFTPTDLKDIEDRCGHGNTDRCLQEVLEKWLKERPIVPTWNTLIAVLQEDTVKEEGVAEDVEKFVNSRTPPSGGDIDPVHARSSSGSKHSVQQPDVNVNIRGETYSAIAIPAENSRVVQEVRLELLAAIEPKQLVNDCEALEGLIRLTYNGIGAAGPKFTELEIEVRRLGSDVKKLCDKSAQVKVRKDILDDLQPVYEYLLDSLEDVAAETLSRVSNVAVQMERASLEMHEDFKQLEKKVVAALERTQRVKGEEALCIVKLQEERAKMEAGLEDARIRRQGGAQSVQEQSEALSEFTRRIGDCRSAEDAADTASKALHVAIQALAKLLAVMMQAGQFWKQMEDHCHSLAESEIQCVIEKVLKLAEQKRLRVWTSDGFKSKVVRYNAQWVAFHYNCTVFVEHMKLSSRAIYQCITEYPTHEESQQILDRLTAQYAMTEMDFR